MLRMVILSRVTYLLIQQRDIHFLDQIYQGSVEEIWNGRLCTYKYTHDHRM
jgi:hypothetical protein